jgi:hypothetical protein
VSVGIEDVFDDGADRFYRELERLLEMLASQRRQLESTTTAIRLLRRSETAEAQVIMAAQRRSIDDEARPK